MLHPLPLDSFGEIAALRLKTKVYCSGCYELPLFATARFHCTKIRYIGAIRSGAGSVRDRAICSTAGGRRTSAGFHVLRDVPVAVGDQLCADRPASMDQIERHDADQPSELPWA